MVGVFSSELKLKLNGEWVIVYLTFTKNFEIVYNLHNVVAIDINENNITVALFKDKRLCKTYRIKTGLSRIAITYAEKRKRITKDRFTKLSFNSFYLDSYISY